MISYVDVNCASSLWITVSLFLSIVPLLIYASSYLSFLSLVSRLTLFQASEAGHSRVTDMWCRNKEAF